MYYIIFGLLYALFVFRGGFLYWLFFTLLNFFLIEYTFNWKIFPLLIWSVNLTLLCGRE